MRWIFMAALAAAALTPASQAVASSLAPGELGAILAQCERSVHPQTEAALILTESSANPLALHDNAASTVPAALVTIPHHCDSSGCGYFPPTIGEARFAARVLIARSESLPHCRRGVAECNAGVDVGIAQINSGNFAALGLTLDTAFDACTNVRESSAMLSRAWRATGDVSEALQTYNSGRPNGAPDYVRGVLANARTIYVRELLTAPADRAAKHADALTRTSAARSSAQKPNHPTTTVTKRPALRASRSTSTMASASSDSLFPPATRADGTSAF